MSYSISKKTKIGKGCTFGQGVIIKDNVELKDGVQVGENTIIYEGTKINSGCQIQPNCLLGVAAGNGDALLELGAGATIRSGSIIYSNVTIGDNFNSGHNILIREGCRIGNRVLIGTYSVLDGFVTVGNDTKIQTGVYLTRNVKVEEEVFLGPYVKTTNDKYMYYGAELKGNVIKKGCRLGCNTILLPGVILAEEVVTGSGTVVVKDVPAQAVVIGNPARIIKYVGSLGRVDNDDSNS